MSKIPAWLETSDNNGGKALINVDAIQAFTHRETDEGPELWVAVEDHKGQLFLPHYTYETLARKLRGLGHEIILENSHE